jgi:hypothetical protein
MAASFWGSNDVNGTSFIVNPDNVARVASVAGNANRAPRHGRRRAARGHVARHAGERGREPQRRGEHVVRRHRGAAHYTLDVGSERFSLVSAVNGEVRYVGTKTGRFVVQGVVNASKAGAATITGLCLAKNGSPITETIVQEQTEARISAFTAMTVVVTLAPNDTVKLLLRNETNTDNYTIHTAGLTVTALGF